MAQTTSNLFREPTFAELMGDQMRQLGSHLDTRNELAAERADAADLARLWQEFLQCERDLDAARAMQADLLSPATLELLPWLQKAASTHPLAAAAQAALAAGLGVNAGHDLNRANLTDFLRAVPGVLEVSIGHALMADALELGLAETVRDYQRCIQAAFTPLPAAAGAAR